MVGNPGQRGHCGNSHPPADALRLVYNTRSVNGLCGAATRAPTCAASAGCLRPCPRGPGCRMGALECRGQWPVCGTMGRSGFRQKDVSCQHSSTHQQASSGRRKFRGGRTRRLPGDVHCELRHHGYELSPCWRQTASQTNSGGLEPPRLERKLIPDNMRPTHFKPRDISNNRANTQPRPRGLRPCSP